MISTRVHKAVNFEQPGRAPIDLAGMKASGVKVFAYRNLREYPGMSGKASASVPFDNIIPEWSRVRFMRE